MKAAKMEQVWVQSWGDLWEAGSRILLEAVSLGITFLGDSLVTRVINM